MKISGLHRQIVLSMTAIAFTVTFLVLLTSYTLCYLLETYWPESYTNDNLVPSGPEWVWMAGITLIGLLLAAVAAFKLSARILHPLNAVAEGLRDIADGNLQARADVRADSMSEIATLAGNFNHLAAQLERVSGEQKFWNAAIAHELRTPVTILKGRLQGMADGVFTADAAQFQQLLRHVDGLARLIEDLRIVSLEENGHLLLSLQDTCLVSELTAVADLFRNEMVQQGQTLVLDLQAGVFRCDPIRIRQALIALLDNARQHADPGKITVSTEISAQTYLLKVSDSGPGIPEDFIAFVFDAFRQAPAKNTAARGSGLGLAVVQTIAHAHGGQAVCYRNAQGGSVFELRWPVAAE